MRGVQSTICEMGVDHMRFSAVIILLEIYDVESHCSVVI